MRIAELVGKRRRFCNTLQQEHLFFALISFGSKKEAVVSPVVTNQLELLDTRDHEDPCSDLSRGSTLPLFHITALLMTGRSN
jgi:hypothetical protein